MKKRSDYFDRKHAREQVALLRELLETTEGWLETINKNVVDVETAVRQIDDYRR